MEKLYDEYKAMLEAKLDTTIKPEGKEDLDQLLKIKHGIINDESYIGWYKNHYANTLTK